MMAGTMGRPKGSKDGQPRKRSLEAQAKTSQKLGKKAEEEKRKRAKGIAALGVRRLSGNAAAAAPSTGDAR